MSRTDEQDTQPLSEHEIERYMAAFQAGLHVMDADPAEASRIGRLAGKTDAHVIGGFGWVASADDSQPSQDLATLLAQPQSELEVAGRPLGIGRRRRTLLPLSDAPERHPSLITAQAELDGERIRGEAELVLRKAELDAELIFRKAELDAQQRLAQARLDVEKESIAERRASLSEAEARRREVTALPDWDGPRTAPRRSWLMSAPVLALAVLATLTSGLWHGSLPLVSIILASAAAAFAVAYSAAILISVLRLVFGSHRGPHPGAATALCLLVGAGSTRRRRVPPE